MKIKKLLSALSVGVIFAGCMTTQQVDPGDRVSTVLNDEAPLLKLTEVNPIEQTVGWGGFMVNTNMLNTNTRPVIAGRICTEYLYGVPNSLFKYSVPPDAKRFFAAASTLSSRSIQFITKIDEKIVFHSKPLEKYPQGFVVIDVAIPPGSKEISLIGDCMGNFDRDHAVWCWPRFYR